MFKPRPMIADQIRMGILPQGYELQESDVGRGFGCQSGFESVRQFDVGRRVWLKSYGIVMENNEQRDKRKGK